MRKQIYVGVALFWLGVGIGMVAMQAAHPKRDGCSDCHWWKGCFNCQAPPWKEGGGPAIACLTLDDGWVCAFNGKELRYDKNGYIMEPK